MIDRFSLVPGEDNDVTGSLPWAFLVIAGAVYAQVLQRHNPQIFAVLGEGNAASELDDLVSVDMWDKV